LIQFGRNATKILGVRTLILEKKLISCVRIRLIGDGIAAPYRRIGH